MATQFATIASFASNMFRGKMKHNSILGILFIFILVGAVTLRSAAVDPQPPKSGPFATPLTDLELDNAASAEWVDGAERPLANPSLLRQQVWTQATAPSNYPFLEFGASNQPGPRHLRLGFTSLIPVGSVLVRGGDQLSVLRADATYPGNLADDRQWIPAQRILNHQIAAAGPEVNKDSYALWVLPSGTKTRALRFTHIATQTDQSYAGVLGGVYVLAGRFANLAPQATVTASANKVAVPLLTDETYNSRGWDNGPDFPHAVTAATPEWITLTWPHPVTLQGLAALWAGFNAADAEVFTGPENIHIQDAPDTDWQSIGRPYLFRSQYPRMLDVDWMDFGKTVRTRAVRLRITQVTDESHHPHLVGATRKGTRVWLNELMAISPLESGDLRAAILPVDTIATPTPPIPVRFALSEPGFVTLIIDDEQGNRVRNLVSDTWFAAGPNTVWWDGTDDLGRNLDAAAHGVYLIPTHFVAPGQYTVRGLYHKAIDLRYELTVYNPGHPAWETVDGKGGWLTNHTPPSAALFLPGDKAPGGKPLIYLGSYVSEGGSGLAWVDLDGHKQGGRGWIGGTWTAAPYLARDTGTRGNSDAYAYVGAVWGDNANDSATSMHVVLRLSALTSHGDKSILKYAFDTAQLKPGEPASESWIDQIKGLAVHDNLAVVSLSLKNQLLFADVNTGKILGTVSVNNPRGVVFDSQGNLLVLSGTHLLSYPLPANISEIHPEQLSSAKTLISEGLEDPAGLTLDSQGNIYISDRGNSNQVQVYSSFGKFLHAIGHAGRPQVGPYDPLHMNNPRGLAIDSNNHLWVAEEDFQPKRVSVWTLDGKLIQAFYGPAEYGGGGALDPQDKTKFYYHQMEFNLDWKTGTNTLTSVLYRPEKNDLQAPKFGEPGTVLYSNGHRYFTNSYLGYATTGVDIGMLYLDEGGVLQPVAAMGKANDWSIFQDDAFRSRLPPNTDLTSRAPDKSILFAWSDINNNHKVDPDEVTFLKSDTGYIMIMSDPAGHGPILLDAAVEGKTMRYDPVRLTPNGIPVYDLQKGTVLVNGAQKPITDGGGQVLDSPQAIVLTTAPSPFAREGLGGVDGQGHRWSYPSLWPGLHPSHSAPIPDFPGELTGTTRLLGGFISPGGEDVGKLWGINGNLGEMYLFTADGLFVTQLFQDVRVGKPWTMPVESRNMLLNDISPHDENFFPSLTQTPDGKVYVVDGARTSIVRVDGLSSLRRLPAGKLNVTREELQAAQNYIKQREELRQDKSGPLALDVTIRSGPAPALKGLIDSLNAASWATIESRITKVGFGDKPDVAEAAITIAGGRLFAAFRINDPTLLRNSGAVVNAPFKTGGALDLMIGVNPAANPKRATPVEGDVRLLVYQVNNKTRALLYRAVVSGTTNPVPFSSPDRTIKLDQVMDVSDLVELDSANGSYAISIPLATLGLKPVAGQKVKADIGILRGNGVQTIQRVYWSNKATGITADVPSEAELTPNLWGEWIFKPAP
jgi:hypothetical protein